MCGIAGICFTEESRTAEEWGVQDIALQLFPALRHRGRHAFGWMSWNGVDPIEHHTFTGDVGLMANLKQVEVDPQAHWLVLHVRLATHGDTQNQHNNHPIVHGDVIGVHNGVLRNEHRILSVTGREFDDAEVDSEAIFAAVDRWGHRPGLRKVEGDMAAVYARRSQPQWLYFAKSYGRPLVFARTKAGSLVFASELAILHDVFGWDLTDVRPLLDRQLVRVADGRVADVGFYAPEPPPEPRKVRQSTTPAPWSRPTTGPIVRGITDYFDPRRSMKPPPPESAPSSRPVLTKKQRARSRRADQAKREETVVHTREEGGLHYYHGILMSREELDLLLEYEQEQDALDDAGEQL